MSLTKFNLGGRLMIGVGLLVVAAGGHGPARQILAQAPAEAFRGIGMHPDGIVDLALYRCYLHLGKADGPQLRDTLPLNKEEWSAFSPPKLAAGTEWAIPADVAKKLVRPFCLNTLGGDMPGPKDAKVAQLTAKVE